MANQSKLDLNLSKKAGLVLAGLAAIATPVILGITDAPELRAQTQAAPAQKITGDWQGKLPAPLAPNGELRLVFRISKADGTTLKAVLYSIDQESTPTATIVTVNGPVVKLSIPAFNAEFGGTLGSDGNTINGKFSQGGKGLPLNLARATTRCGPLPCSPLFQGLSTLRFVKSDLSFPRESATGRSGAYPGGSFIRENNASFRTHHDRLSYCAADGSSKFTIRPYEKAPQR